MVLTTIIFLYKELLNVENVDFRLSGEQYVLSIDQRVVQII